MKTPTLTFFCELESGQLPELFSDDAVIDDLAALGAGVSLGLLDLSPERADVVRRLNRAGVPVTAWQLLPKEQGYWYNVNNAVQASARYQAFQTWTAEHGLQWAAIGIDIEPDRAEIERFAAQGWGSALPTLLRRAFDDQRLAAAIADYTALVGQMRRDGYLVESYHLPFIVDERKAGSKLLQKVGGLLDVPTDREVLMLYTSFATAIFGPEIGPGMLWSYAPEAEAIAVGSTGGGVDTAGADHLPVLDWEGLARDLRLAARWTDQLYLFSLEGCVRQGFLKRLRETFADEAAWAGPLEPPLEAAQRATAVRRAIQAALWLTAHPWVVLAGLMIGLWLLRPRRREG